MIIPFVCKTPFSGCESFLCLCIPVRMHFVRGRSGLFASLLILFRCSSYCFGPILTMNSLKARHAAQMVRVLVCLLSRLQDLCSMGK